MNKKEYTKVSIFDSPDILKLRVKNEVAANLLYDTPYIAEEVMVKKLAEEIQPHVDRGFCFNEETMTCIVTDTLYFIPKDCKEILVPITQTKTLNKEDLQELEHRYGKEVRATVEDMLSAKGTRWRNDTR